MHRGGVAAMLGDEGSASVRTWRQDVTGDAGANVGRAKAGLLGLPDAVTAGLFDLDGVLTNTAAMHNKAWQEMFDALLRERAERRGEQFVGFDLVADPVRYVDDKPRADGGCDFMASRGITLHEGSRDDSPRVESVNGLASVVVIDLAELLNAAGGKAAP
jgi:hypothetical protein